MKYTIKKVSGRLAVRICKNTTMEGTRYEVGFNRILFPRLTKRPAREFATLYIYSR